MSTDLRNEKSAKFWFEWFPMPKNLSICESQFWAALTPGNRLFWVKFSISKLSGEFFFFIFLFSNFRGKICLSRVKRLKKVKKILFFSGVITQGEMDNGRGKARLNLFRHLHEFQSGRTSSISLDVVGFDAKGEVRNKIHWKKYKIKRKKGNKLM